MADAALPAEVAGDADSARDAKSRRISGRKLALSIFGVVALVAAFAWWLFHRGIESTDDAQIDADIVQVQTQIAGTIIEVLFQENQAVRAGQMIARLDDSEARARLAQAEANLAAAEAAADAADADARVIEANAVGNRSIAVASLRVASAAATGARDSISEAEASLRSAQASLEQARVDRARQQQLYSQGSTSAAALQQSETATSLAEATERAAEARLAMLRSSVAEARGQVAEASARVLQNEQVQAAIDKARADAREARALVDVARANRDLAGLELSYTRILAPASGVLSKKSIAIGQRLPVGFSVAQLVPSPRWVTANFKETEIGAMRVGQPATFTVDTYPGVTFHAVVDSFAGATGSRFTLLPPDNASGNFTKVVQRVAVRLRITRIPSGVVLRPGMSVLAEVHTRSRPL